VRLLRLLREPAVIAEADAGREPDQQVVHAQQASRTGAEEGQDEVEDQETLPVDQALPLREFDRVPGGVADREAVDGAGDAFVEDGNADPVESHLVGIVTVSYDVDGQVDERKRHAVVASRLGGEDISKVFRDPPGELALADHRRGQHGIRRRHAGRTCQALQPAERGDHPPDEEAGDQPAPGHDGHEEQENGLPVPLHVRLGQFHPDGEALDDQDDARALESDLVDIAPGLRVEEVGGMGAEDDAAEGCDGGLTDVELLLDEQRAEHEQRGEATQDHVRHMGLIDIEVFPRHGGDRLWVSPHAERATRSVFVSLRHLVCVKRSSERPRGPFPSPVPASASKRTDDSLHTSLLFRSQRGRGSGRGGPFSSGRRGGLRGREGEERESGERICPRDQETMKGARPSGQGPRQAGGEDREEEEERERRGGREEERVETRPAGADGRPGMRPAMQAKSAADTATGENRGSLMLSLAR